MNRVLIVGASAGGLITAEALRRAGYRGALTLVGDEPHPPYDRPPLSKQILTGEWEPGRLPLRRDDDIEALGLDLRLGVAATGLDVAGRAVELADGARVPYDGLVVATGVRSRRLPGSEGVTGIHTLRTLDDALTLKDRLRPGRRLVIVGAGFVGAEVAAVARGLGVAVTMLEAGPVPMAQAVGEQAGRFLAQVHRDHGVDLRTGAAVREVVGAGGAVSGVRLGDGTVLPADDVLVAIGSVPNTGWLEGSGLPLADGLVCDEFSAAAPGVYGAGDVARWHNPLFGTAMRLEHRTNAAEQGMAVARNLLSPEARRPFAPVPYFWSDQYDMKIQAYGHLRGHDEAVVVDGDIAQRRFLLAYRTDERLTGVLSVGMPPKTLRAWRAMIAAGAAWAHAVSTAAARP
ncbi:NAD(P)/FAD-dependent oxidoreductase [Microbispora siamensis]|uniref:Pyridine nucleotide-disulfide oxidoreductase n=1 Tax=Microbispora siamensis TaxID=564413 RepID=A0ABQ4GMU2_9ACTN|nr:FAD-dependent oxidoreductase [Microbispora siamensis]GIH62753.1 pyridine nucleotide-disulfide oxidoreductase [Microbispora siamensis]